ncbi:MAG: hypothetical protein BRD55_01170 [Bacteroidetes bacterium SW_9_63_38]|nr:MAG: hypothetical protein BRD55_01170 [Bacteroidetes bacterium SW_9_63_38]
MPRRRTSFWPLLVIVAAGLMPVGVGCTSGETTVRTTSRAVAPQAPSALIAEVDSIEAPSRMKTADTLSVRLRGTVGPNGCYSFHRTAIERESNRVRLVPLVRRASQNACTTALVPLDETVRVKPPFEPDPLTITVPQPNRTNVTATVSVADSTE